MVHRVQVGGSVPVFDVHALRRGSAVVLCLEGTHRGRVPLVCQDQCGSFLETVFKTGSAPLGKECRGLAKVSLCLYKRYLPSLLQQSPVLNGASDGEMRSRWAGCVASGQERA